MQEPAPTKDVRSTSRSTDNLTRRVLGWMLLISLVPLVVMAGQGYHCAAEAVVEKTNNHLLAVLNSRHALIDEWTRQRTGELELLASAPYFAEYCSHEGQELADVARDSMETTFGAIQSAVGAYAALALYDADWRSAAVGRANIVDPEEWLTEALRAQAADAQDMVYGDVQRTNGGMTGVAAVKPIVNSDGAHVGAILAVLNLSNTLEGLLQNRSGMGETGKVYLTGPGGTVLTEPFPNRAGRAAFVSQVRENSVAADGRVRRYRDYRGEDVLGAAMGAPVGGWMLVAEIDHSEAMAWLGILARRATVTGAITLVVLVGAAMLVSDRLGRPLRELARVAKRIRGGHVHERLEPVTGADAEEVRQAFNEMLDDLQHKQSELVRAATLASVGELSTSIVHEMRNPLSSIKMNVQALSGQVSSDPAFSELARIATDQVARLEHMLDDLLHFGRPVTLNREETDFEELAEEVLQVVDDSAQARGVTVRVENSLNGARLNVDREQMRRALTNLVVNAVQASPPGAAVELRAGADSDPDAPCVIGVTDHGEGFSPEARESLFKPFFTTKTGGTGLGLANVRKIVELHGGRVSAENRPGGGAHVEIRLPPD